MFNCRAICCRLTSVQCAVDRHQQRLVLFHKYSMSLTVECLHAILPTCLFVFMPSLFMTAKLILFINSPSVSKQQAVIPSQVFELPDGSSSYQDFSLTRNNRFSSTQSSRNIIQAPTAVLHFYNAPPTLSQHQLQKVEALAWKLELEVDARE